MTDRLTIERDWVLVAGPDAAPFLQGQLSQDVAALVPGAPWTYSLLLAPTGKVDAWLGVHRLGEEEFLLDTDPGWGEAVVTRLARFKLRTKATIEPVSGWRCTAAATDVLDRTLVHADDADPADPADPEAPADREAYEVARIEQGIPVMGAELTVDTIPAEAGSWLVERSVSFTKGCYTGQELVARIDSRGGNVPRHLRGIALAAPGADLDPPPPGTGIVVDGSPVGTVTSSTRSAAFGPIALAFVHRSVDPPAEATLATPDGARARVVVLPFT